MKKLSSSRGLDFRSCYTVCLTYPYAKCSVCILYILLLSKRDDVFFIFFYALQKIGLALLCLKESYIQQPKDSFIQGPTQSIVCIQNVYEFTYGGVVGNIYISCMNIKKKLKHEPFC